MILNPNKCALYINDDLLAVVVLDPVALDGLAEDLPPLAPLLTAGLPLALHTRNGRRILLFMTGSANAKLFVTKILVI